MVLFDGYSAEYDQKLNLLKVKLKTGVNHVFTETELGVVLIVIRDIAERDDLLVDAIHGRIQISNE